MRATALAVVTAALVLPLAGCSGSPLGTCTQENVVVEMPATLSVGGAARAVTLAGRLSEDNVDPATFRRVRRVVMGAEGEAGVFAFTVEPRGSGEPAIEFLALAVRAPLRDGAVLQVRTAVQGGGWGFLSLASGEDATAGIRAGGAYASSVSGTVEVLDASPLRLRVDLRATGAGGEAIRVQGDAAFSFLDDRVPCS